MLIQQKKVTKKQVESLKKGILIKSNAQRNFIVLAAELNKGLK